MGMFFFLILLIAVVDQVFKYLVRVYIPIGCCFDTVLPFLKITHVENAGAAFGTMIGMRVYLIVCSLVILGLAVYCILKKDIKNLLFLTFAALIFGGGLSNLYDRIVYGFVTDYLKLSFFPPVCNLADYCICLGTSAILLFLFINNDCKK